MSDIQESARTRKIRALNNHARITFTGCSIMLTDTVAAMDDEPKTRLLEAVRTFDDFNEGNDPHCEADMGFLDFEGEKYMWVFSYYAPDMQHGSDDPSDVAKTRRVLTVMHASEY